MIPSHHFKSFSFVPVLLFCLLLSASLAEGKVALKGKVHVEGDKGLQNLVIYLEPVGEPKGTRPQRTHRVSQKGRRFKPSFVVVTLGDTIQYLNDEDKEIDHNIYSLSRPFPFDLGLGERGSVLQMDVKITGQINFFCSVHKLMEGKMVILPSEYFVVLEEPGRFILPDVPNGKWRVRVYVSHRRYKSIPFEISVDGSPLKEIVLEVVKK